MHRRPLRQRMRAHRAVREVSQVSRDDALGARLIRGLGKHGILEVCRLVCQRTVQHCAGHRGDFKQAQELEDLPGRLLLANSLLHLFIRIPIQRYSVFAMLRLMTWEIKYHDEKLQAAVLALPAGLLARYLHLADRMVQYGPDLGMPHTRAMGSGLFEMRLKSREGIARVFYCTLVKRRVVMLHQFVKKTGKTPPGELAVARKRMKEWNDVDA